jgi:hypothetical protein
VILTLLKGGLMSLLARQLAMAFLENRPIKMNDTVITMTEYVLSGTTIAKWDNSDLLVTFPSDNIKVVKNRMNAVLECFGCGVSIEAFGNRYYFVDNTEKMGSLRDVELNVWYLIQKNGFILRKWK